MICHRLCFKSLIHDYGIGIFFFLILTGCHQPLSPIEKIIQSLGNLPEYSIIMVDMKTEGEFFSQHFHKYRIINQDRDEVTPWLSVSEAYYQAHELFLGMVIAGKSEGKEIYAKAPPGYQYVANRRYGHWRQTANGCVLWEFYAKYNIFYSVFGAIAEIDLDDYNAYKKAILANRPFFGRNNQYGVNGYKTKLLFPDFYQRQQQRSETRNMSLSDRINRRLEFRDLDLIDPRPEGEARYKTILDRVFVRAAQIILFLLLFFFGVLFNDVLHYQCRLMTEVIEKRNTAISIAASGYYLGLLFCLYGPISGSERGFIENIIDLAMYGALGMVWLNVSWFIYSILLLRQYDMPQKLLREQNLGAGFMAAGVNIGSGMIIFGVSACADGSVWLISGFWLVGFALLLLAGYLHSLIIPYDLYEEIQHGNTAAGIRFLGAVTAAGLVIGLSAKHSFSAGADHFIGFLSLTFMGLILLPAIRLLIDRFLRFSVDFTNDTISPEASNTGSACIEAVNGIIAVLIILWWI